MGSAQKFYVYKITNLVNGKIYVGKTNNPQTRFKRHLWDSGETGDAICPKLHHSIAKYGQENFEFSILHEFENEQEAYDKEEELINLWDTVNSGLNIAPGGKGGFSFPTTCELNTRSVLYKEKDKIIKYYCEDLLSSYDIAKIYNVSRVMINHFLRNEGNKSADLKRKLAEAKEKILCKAVKSSYEDLNRGRAGFLSYEEKVEIKRSIVAKIPYEYIMQRYNIGRSYIANIARGEGLKNIHVDGFTPKKVKTPVKISDEIKNQIIQMDKNGLTSIQIGNNLNLIPGTIRSILMRHRKNKKQ